MIIATSWYADEVVTEYSQYAASRQDGSVRVFGTCLYVAWVSIIPHTLEIIILGRQVCSCDALVYEDVGSGRSSERGSQIGFYGRPRENSVVFSTQKPPSSKHGRHFISKEARMLGSGTGDFV